MSAVKYLVDLQMYSAVEICQLVADAEGYGFNATYVTQNCSSTVNCTVDCASDECRCPINCSADVGNGYCYKVHSYTCLHTYSAGALSTLILSGRISCVTIQPSVSHFAFTANSDNQCVSSGTGGRERLGLVALSSVDVSVIFKRRSTASLVVPR